MASTCQRYATWGLMPMTGWMQCLDTSWYMTLKKEEYNFYQKFLRADKTAMTSQVKDLTRRFDRK
jgi:hypothetical protein